MHCIAAIASALVLNALTCMPVDEHKDYTIEYDKTEIELLATVCMAEAEGESELGKRLVIDTVLNRVDHDNFDDDVHSVIYAKNQFTSMTNGRADSITPSDYIYQLVYEEIENRTDYEVLWFRADHYGKYGEQYINEGNHYFSKEKNDE